MDVVVARACGLDVHKRTVVACLLTPGPDGTLHKELRTFSRVTADLLRLADWLLAAACTHVAMESTGIYVRRITARAIPPAGRLGSEGNPRVNDLPRGESQREQQHVVEAERPRRRVWSGSARPVC